MNEKDRLYMDIAKACLAALNNSHAASPEKAYQAVYEAIDKAFESQFQQLGHDYQSARAALESIAKLPTSESATAQAIAQNALKAPH